MEIVANLTDWSYLRVIITNWLSTKRIIWCEYGLSKTTLSLEHWQMSLVHTVSGLLFNIPFMLLSFEGGWSLKGDSSACTGVLVVVEVAEGFRRINLPPRVVIVGEGLGCNVFSSGGWIWPWTQSEEPGCALLASIMVVAASWREKVPDTAETVPGTAETVPGTAETEPGTAETEPGTAETELDLALCPV